MKGRREGNRIKIPELSDICVNADGKLCQVVLKDDLTVNKLFNCVRWEYCGAIYLAFNPEFITHAGW
jgi:hypothetical protein